MFGLSPRPRELPTKYAKIVVTDDLGRYLIPDLPPATYSIWVRGYGLVEFPKVQRAPGRNLDLTAVAAPDAKAAAQYYPAHLLVFDAENSAGAGSVRRQGATFPRK